MLIKKSSNQKDSALFFDFVFVIKAYIDASSTTQQST
jgi:hypothetical protein